LLFIFDILAGMKKAPDFSLPDQDGINRSLGDYVGKWLLVYFYPKNDTPGCTTEACSFRDEYEYLQEQGLNVVGISKDSVKSHAKFADKYNLKFPLLSDESGKTIHAYDAWGLKKFMGRQYEGILRKSFLINPSGQIAKEYPKVTPKAHVGEILKDFAELKAA
jgi:thioredoxin-dependent peroxiredoxin